MELTDSALVEKWKTLRDAEAFSELVTRHSAMVYRVACRILRDPGHAEEVAQECFLTLAQNPSAVKRSPVGWLHALAVSRALDRLKSERRRLARETDYAAQADAISIPRWNDVQGFVDEAVADLPEPQRDAVIYRYLENHSLDETARHLSISRSTVQRWLETSVGAIRQHLEHRGVAISAGALLSTLGAGSTEAAPAALAFTLGKLALAGTTGVPACSGVSSTAVTGGVLVMKKAMVGMVVVLGILAGLYWSIQAHQAPNSDTAPVIASSVGTTAKTAADQPDSAATTPAGVSQPAVITKTVETPGTSTLEPGEIADPAKYASLSGRTITEAGEPVPGAEVILVCYGIPENEFPGNRIEYEKKALQRNHQFKTVSDAEGRFIINRIRFSGYATVYAQAQETLFGRSVVEFKEGMHCTKDIAMQDGGHIVRGRILTASGVPVDDASVRLADSHSSLCQTNTYGNFEVVCLLGGALNVYSPKYGVSTFTYLKKEKDKFHELRMPGMASLCGRITQSDGSPAVGFKVELYGHVICDAFSTIGYMVSVVTDLNGQYKISDINVGQKMEATITDTKGKHRIKKSLGHLPPNQVTTWDAQLSKPIVVRGTVRGMYNHQPLAMPGLFHILVVKDGQTLVIEGGTSNAFSEGIYEITVPGGSGRYRIIPIYSTITLYSCDYFESHGREVYLTEGTDQTVDLELPEPVTVKVLVVDENGNPVKGAKAGLLGSMTGDIGLTDELGRLTYTGFVPNTMGNSEGGSIEITCSGYFTEKSRSFSGSPGQILPEETIMLYPAGEAVGRLVSRDGEPMANGKCWVKITYGDSKQQSFMAVIDSKGQFRLKIPATLLDLEGSFISPHSFSRTGLRCPAGQTLDLGDIPLENIDRTSEE